jgi:diguanylate cyclase (GGDEF)-like protein/PAS domain S-box-containing protein
MSCCPEVDSYAAVFEQAAVGIARVAPDGSWLEVNQRLCDIVGYTRDELLACTFQDITHPDDLDEDLGLVGEMLAGTRERYTLEKRYLHKAGHLVPIRLDVALVRHADGRPDFFISVVQDITPQRTAEAEAERRGQQLVALLENTTDFIYIKDERSHILACSQTMAELTGHSHWRQVVGKHDRDIFPPDTARIYEEEERPLYAGESDIVDRTDPYWTPDGERRWVHTNKWPVKDADGAVVGLVGISRDVTDRKRLQDHLESTEERLRIAGSLSYDASYEWWPSRDRIDWYGGVDGLLGLPDGTLGPRLSDWLAQVHPDDRDRVRGVLDDAVRRHAPFEMEYRIRNPSIGERIWRERGEPVLDQHSGPAHWVGVCTDLTEQRTAEAQQRAAVARLRLARDVFDFASEGITITDAEGTILDVNEAFTEITGYSRDEAVGQNPRLLKSGRHPRAFYQAMREALRTRGEWSGEIWNRRKTGEVYPERLTISAVRDDAGVLQNYVALFADITRQKRFEADLRHSAQHDALTGLPNRLLLRDRLEQALARARRNGARVAVVYLDLDGFKGVNDTHGHAVGDELLIAISGALHACVRAHDTVARIGGDEFVAVLTDLQPDQDPTPELERLRAAAARSYRIAGHILRLSASLGVSMYPQDPAVDADGLLRQADQAMYRAKETGKNRIEVFEPEANRDVHERQALLVELGRAITQDQLELHHQPKVDMRTGAVVGVEALVRWRHPTRGLLGPGAFVPLTEGNDRGVELGDWVLRRALEDAAGWREAGLDVRVSVNISPHHLQWSGFLPRLAALLEQTGSRVDLEIVESSQLNDVVETGELLRSCHELGATVSIDDFGTGYASLTWLRRLPVDTVKIDRTFVGEMLEEAESRAIVEATLGLAQAFDLGIVAEGVEEEAQGVALLARGCDVAQGYAIARPMTAAALPAWEAQWRPPEAWRVAPAPASAEA